MYVDLYRKHQKCWGNTIIYTGSNKNVEEASFYTLNTQYVGETHQFIQKAPKFVREMCCDLYRKHQKCRETHWYSQKDPENNNKKQCVLKEEPII